MGWWKGVIELARVSNLVSVWGNALAGWLLGGGLWGEIGWVWIGLGYSLLYMGGMTLNDAADAGWDRQRRPERPIPRGAVGLRTAWLLAVGQLGLGAWVVVAFGGAPAWGVLVVVGLIVGYDLYHKPWAGSVVVMGMVRGGLYLLAAAAAGRAGGAGLTPVVWLWGGAMCCYVVGVSLSARAGSTGGSLARLALGLLLVPGLLLVLLLVLLLIGGGAVVEGRPPVPLAGLVVLGVGLWWVVRQRRLVARDGAGAGVGWLLAGLLVVDAMAVVLVHELAGLILVLGAPVSLWWQRFVAVD